MRGQAKIVCKGCKENISSDLFPDGHLQSDKYFMVCSGCRKSNIKTFNTTEHFRRIKSKYEKMIKYRTEASNLKLQDEMWSRLDYLDLDADATSFTDSEEMNDMMKRYEEALILKLSGIEDKMPEWMDPEDENEK